MIEKDYSSLDQIFFENPFRPRHLTHVKVADAFAGSKLPKEVMNVLLYHFVLGTPQEYLVRLQVHKFIDDGLPKPKEIQIDRTISIQAIRKIFSDWRHSIFRNPETRRNIFMNFLMYSISCDQHRERYIDTINQYLAGGFTEKGKPTDDPDCVAYWESLSYCLFDCPSAMTVGELKKEHHCFTAPDYYTSIWWGLLEREHSTQNFTPWAKARGQIIEEHVREVSKRTSRKFECGRCPNRTIRNLHNYQIQSVMQYLARFRIKDIETFHDFMFSALIYAFIKSDVWTTMRGLKSIHDRWDHVPDDAQKSYKHWLYELDNSQDKLINGIAGTIIDAIARQKWQKKNRIHGDW